MIVESKNEIVESNNNRSRVSLIITLVEGDVLVEGETFKHVANGEVSIWSDGTIDESNGELIEVSIDAVPQAMSAGATLFNMEDVKDVGWVEDVK